MYEGPPTTEDAYEEGPEHIPTKEEVVALITALHPEKEYEIAEEREDERGLYYFDLKTEDVDGSPVEYSYMRAGNYEDSFSKKTVIDAFWPEEEIGRNVGTYEGGEWRMTS